jgi:hypothetical protein
MTRLNKRLQVIEGSENDGNYCGCFTEYQMAEIEKIYDGVPHKIDFESLPKDFCGKCRKPVNTEFIESFYENLAAILPMYEGYEIQMPVNVGPTFSDGAARMVRKVAEVPSGMTLRSEVALRLEIKAGDVERYIRSGRLQTDGSKRFVTQESFDELKMLLIRQRNEPPERF